MNISADSRYFNGNLLYIINVWSVFCIYMKEMQNLCKDKRRMLFKLTLRYIDDVLSLIYFILISNCISYPSESKIKDTTEDRWFASYLHPFRGIVEINTFKLEYMTEVII